MNNSIINRMGVDEGEEKQENIDFLGTILVIAYMDTSKNRENWSRPG